MNIKDKVRIFNDALLDSYDKHAPFRVIQPRHLPAPWLTQELKSLMKERQRTRRVWRKRTDENHAHFKYLRNLVQRRARSAKEDYFQAEFRRVNQPNLIWRKLRHLGLLKLRTSAERLVFSVDNLSKYFVGGEDPSDDEKI